jgi:general stress protein 26
VIFTTRPERAKSRYLELNPHVNLTVFDLQDPYRYVEIGGTATLDGDERRAAEHIHQMSHKYDGVDYPDPDGRVLVRVRPERVHTMGVD